MLPQWSQDSQGGAAQGANTQKWIPKSKLKFSLNFFHSSNFILCRSQTLVVKVCGVICSVVGGLAVGKVNSEPPRWASNCAVLVSEQFLIFSFFCLGPVMRVGRAHDSLRCCRGCRSLPRQEHIFEERLQGVCVCVCA